MQFPGLEGLRSLSDYRQYSYILGIGLKVLEFRVEGLGALKS